MRTILIIIIVGCIAGAMYAAYLAGKSAALNEVNQLMEFTR